MRDLPVLGVLPDPDMTIWVDKYLYFTTRIRYRKEARCEEKLAETNTAQVSLKKNIHEHLITDKFDKRYPGNHLKLYWNHLKFHLNLL